MTGYPTLKFFKKEGEEEAEKYRGQRDLANLNKFVAQKLGKEVEVSERVQKYHTFLGELEVFIDLKNLSLVVNLAMYSRKKKKKKHKT